MTFSTASIGAAIAAAATATWAFVKSLFTKQSALVIWKILLSSASTAVMKKLNDGTLQQTALQVAQALMNSNLSGSEKAAAFNQILTDQLKATGKEIGSSSLNALREMALQAVNVQAEKGELVAVADTIKSAVAALTAAKADEAK